MFTIVTNTCPVSERLGMHFCYSCCTRKLVEETYLPFFKKIIYFNTHVEAPKYGDMISYSEYWRK